MAKKSLIPTHFDYQSIYFSDSSDYDDLQILDPNFACESKQETTPFFNIDVAMQDAYRKNEGKILAESIRPIAPGIYANYNSLNILVGNQGKGKTHIMLRDIIQISRLKDANLGKASGHSPFHLPIQVVFSSEIRIYIPTNSNANRIRRVVGTLSKAKKS